MRRTLYFVTWLVGLELIRLLSRIHHLSDVLSIVLGTSWGYVLIMDYREGKK